MDQAGLAINNFSASAWIGKSYSSRPSLQRRIVYGMKMTDQAKLRRLKSEDYVTKPWKNGHGVTRDVILWPASEDFDIRVSLADIPPVSVFSSFPGITRHITRLSGDAMTLTFADGQVEHLRLLTPLTFDSAKAPSCEAAGAQTRVLNVMTRTTSWRSSVRVLPDGHHRAAPPAGGMLLLFAATGSWMAGGVNCTAGEALLAMGSDELTLTGDPGAKALLAGLEPVVSSKDAAFGFFEAIGRN
jgi:environmental stress-induced protein Ves